MSERFSVEDILKEVKNMTGEHYVTSSEKMTENYEENLVQQEQQANETDNQLNLFAQQTEDEVLTQSEEESVSNELDFYKNNESKKSEYADLSADDFLAAINKRISGENKKHQLVDIEIVDGFVVTNKEKSQDAQEDKETEQEVVEEVFEKSAVDEIEEEPQESQEDKEVLDKTLVFDKEEVLAAIDKEKTEETQTDVDFAEIQVHKDHKPEHLLSADEIKSGDMKSNSFFRFGSKLKDLTKKNDEDDFSIFKRPEQPVGLEEVETTEKTEVPEVNVVEEIPQTDSNITEESEEQSFFETLNEQYEDEEKAKSIEANQPDVLNNDIELEEQVEKIPVDEAFMMPNDSQAVSLENPVENTSDNRFSRKTIRKVEEVSFDYSETIHEDEDVIDDYSSIEDEEAVRYDLDLSLRRVSNRLVITIIAFVLSFVVSVLPSLNIELLSVISPTTNLNGFLIANAAVLLFALIINFTGFISGLCSFFTFRPNSDSALSLATAFVVAQSAIAFAPEFGGSAGVVPFYSAGLIFAYILNLIGKKAMVLRIKSNFRMVATTSIKQSCFLADEKLSEMLENDDFVGAPYTAVSKGALNLQNYLKNSYCEDPSDNISKLFSIISFVASVVTFMFVYFTSKDVMSALSYATAVALLATPVCAIMVVNSPIKKASIQFRQEDGLLTSYATINEFSDIDCVVVEAEKLFPAGSVEMTNLSAVGDVSIEEVILKSAALAVNAGGPLADVFDKIVDGRRKMLPPVFDIVYEDGFGLTGNVDGKTVRIGNHKFMDAYGIYGLSDDGLELRATQEGMFIVYTAIEDEVCGMFALKYKSIVPDIEDAVYNLVANGVSLVIKTNDPNVTPELIERVFEVPKEYVSVMEAQTTEYYDEISRPSKKGDSLLAYGGRFSTLANLLIACKKLSTKITATILIQAILCVVGFGFGMFCAVVSKRFDMISTQNIILYQLAATIITMFISSVVKRLK